MALTLDSGASDHRIDADLIVNVHQYLSEFKRLQTPNVIHTAGNRTAQEIATDKLRRNVQNNKGRTHPVTVAVTLVPGLDRRLSSPGKVHKKGVPTGIDKAAHLLVAGSTLPLRCALTSVQ